MPGRPIAVAFCTSQEQICRSTLPSPRKSTIVIKVGARVAGLGRVVSAVPGVADAFGYDIDAALEDPDDH
jgi:hypothetical protein